MYFTLSKLLPSLILPYSLLFWILIYALYCLKKKYYSRLKWLLIGTFSGLYILSLPLLSGWHSGRSLEKWDNFTLSEDSTDAVVVLGGFMVPDRFFGYGVESPFDRLLTGIRLVRTQKAKYVILSGGKSEFEITRKAEAEYMLDFIQEFNALPDSLIWMETKSTTTYENAVFSKQLIESKRASLKIFLVTSLSHMDRAMQLFENEGFEVLPVPVDFPESPQWTESFLFTFIPSTYSLNYWSKVYRETMGSVVYNVFQWFKN